MFKLIKGLVARLRTNKQLYFEKNNLAMLSANLYMRNEALQDSLVTLYDKKQREGAYANNLIAALMASFNLTDVSISKALLDATNNQTIKVNFNKDKEEFTLTAFVEAVESEQEEVEESER